MSTLVLSPVQETDLLLDLLGSATPPVVPNDWKLESLLLRWRRAVESRPMPAGEVAA